MIVVLLVVIWGIALVPLTVRWLSERQLATSVARFMRARRTLRQSYPPLVALGTDSDLPLAVEQVRRHLPNEQEARIRRQRAQLRIEQRRRTLATLGGGTVVTALIGAVPHLHALWDVTFGGIALTATYVVLLARLTQREQAVRARRRQATTREVLRPDERELLVANSRFGSERSRVVPQPAFVLVEAPS